MSRYFYSLISKAQGLKVLHEEAVLHGKLEVGLSGGKILYAWDEDRQNIRVINTEEAAERLGLTVAQVDQIIATNAEVVFDAPEEEDIIEDVLDDLNTEEVLSVEPKEEAIATVEPIVVEEKPEPTYSDALIEKAIAVIEFELAETVVEYDQLSTEHDSIKAQLDDKQKEIKSLQAIIDNLNAVVNVKK